MTINVLRKALTVIISVMFIFMVSAAVGIAANTMKITGIINNDGQLVDESGHAYDISDEGVGSDAMEYSGEKVMADAVGGIFDNGR